MLLSCNTSSTTTKTTYVNPHAEPHIEMHREIQRQEAEKKLKETYSNDFLFEKWERGIDFYATGNEPFWSLEMDLEKQSSFKTMNNTYNAPAVSPVNIVDTNITRYRSITESGEVIIQLNKKKCADTMSDQVFNYQVTVDYKTSNSEDYQTYNGCGNYIPNPLLHNIWVITKVNNTVINLSDFKTKPPYLELNITKESIYGTDGCNSFRGKIEIEGNQITFSQLASSMMACANNVEISAQITKVISNQKVTYTHANNLLTFFKGNKEVMVLKPVD